MSYIYRGKMTLKDYNKWLTSGRMIGLMKPVDQPLIKIEIEESIESPDATVSLTTDGRLQADYEYGNEGDKWNSK